MDRNLVSVHWTHPLTNSLWNHLKHQCSPTPASRRWEAAQESFQLPTWEKPHVRTSCTQPVSLSSRSSGALTELGFTWFPRDKLRGWTWNPQRFTCTVSTAEIFLLPPTFRAAWEVPTSNASGSCTAAAGAQSRANCAQKWWRAMGTACLH